MCLSVANYTLWTSIIRLGNSMQAQRVLFGRFTNANACDCFAIVAGHAETVVFSLAP